MGQVEEGTEEGFNEEDETGEDGKHCICLHCDSYLAVIASIGS